MANLRQILADEGLAPRSRGASYYSSGRPVTFTVVIPGGSSRDARALSDLVSEFGWENTFLGGEAGEYQVRLNWSELTDSFAGQVKKKWPGATFRFASQGKQAGDRSSPFTKTVEKFLGMHLTRWTPADRVRIRHDNDGLWVTCYNPNVWAEYYAESERVLKLRGLDPGEWSDEHDEIDEEVGDRLFNKTEAEMKAQIADFFGISASNIEGGHGYDGGGHAPSVSFRIKNANWVWPTSWTRA
jgi:hypothetical protein